MQRGSSRLNAWILANSSCNLWTKSSSKDTLWDAFGVVERWQRKSVMVFGTKEGLKSKLSSSSGTTKPMLACVLQCNVTKSCYDDKRVFFLFFCFVSCSGKEINYSVYVIPWFWSKKSGEGLKEWMIERERSEIGKT